MKIFMKLCSNYENLFDIMIIVIKIKKLLFEIDLKSKNMF